MVSAFNSANISYNVMGEREGRRGEGREGEGRREREGRGGRREEREGEKK